jgi:predicted dehydrogenase
MTQERFKTLVVGVGSIGERHVRCFLATDRTDVAICEPNEQLRTQIAKRYCISESYSTFEESLEYPFDLAVIATPPQLHIPQAIDLARHGVNLLIEKPLSLSCDGLDELNDWICRSDLIAGVAFPYRAHPALVEMRAAIASGRFGRPLHVTVVAGQNFPTYRPAYRQTYYRTRQTGGGAIQDALSHLVNAVEWFVGNATRVIADAERLALDGVEVEDTTNLLARHGDVLASYSLNQHQPANELTIDVVCELGQARFEGHRKSWSWLLEVDGQWETQHFDDLDRDTVFRRQAELFLSAVEQGSQPLCTVSEGSATMLAILASLRSLDSHCWESVAS